jgi:hypothetical protein
MSHFDSPIIRLTTGNIDTINDVVVAGAPAFGTSTTVSMLAGQLGQGFWLDDSAIQYASSTAVYGGHFRYVRLSSAATTLPVRGQIVFWDLTSVAVDNLYQVTTLESGSTTGALFAAGIVLNGTTWAKNNYSVIQDVGPCYVQFRGTLTGAASAFGAGVFCAGAGAGVDNGFADVQTQSTSITDVMLQRFLGTAIDAPTNGSLSRVYLRFGNVRG